jgi:hypothetical protein
LLCRRWQYVCVLSPPVVQAADPLERAVKRIEKNDADGLRRLLAQDPSLARGTGAGLLPHWLVQGRLLWKGQPNAGATVYVEDDPAFGSARYRSTTTDDQGRFSMTAVPPGKKRVGVNGNHRVSWISAGEPFVTAAEQSKMVLDSFNQDFHVCHVFDLGSPAQNESVGSRPVLRWDAYPGAKGYIVHLFDRTSWTVLGWRLGDGATSVQVDSDLPPGSYQWRVDAVAPGGDVIACSAAPRGFIVHPQFVVV